MGLFLNKQFVVGSPTAGVTHKFYNDVDDVLSNLTMYNGHVERNGNFWTIVYDVAEGGGYDNGNDQIQDTAGAWSDGDTTGVSWNMVCDIRYDDTNHKLQYKKRACQTKEDNTWVGKLDTAWTDITTAVACP